MSEMTEQFMLNERFKEVYNLLEQRGVIVKSGRGERSKSSFADKLGTTGSVIEDYLNSRRLITYNRAKTLCQLYGISEHFMLHGKGKPFGGLNYDGIIESKTSAPLGNIFLTSVDAFAGNTVATDSSGETERFSLPGIRGEHYAFTVSGNSMLPTLNDSDMIICREVDDWRNIRDKHLYAVLVRGQSLVVKRVKKIMDGRGNCIRLTLISDNYVEYPAYDVEMSEVLRVLEVRQRISETF